MDAFDCCERMRSVTIAPSVTSIDRGAFYGCVSLDDVYYNGPREQWQTISIDYLNDSLEYYSEKHFLMPDAVLPAELTEVEEEAFAGGVFTYVCLPENAASVRAQAFAACPNLAYVRVPNATTVINASAFEGVNNPVIIGVKGSKAETFANQNGLTFLELIPYE